MTMPFAWRSRIKIGMIANLVCDGTLTFLKTENVRRNQKIPTFITHICVQWMNWRKYIYITYFSVTNEVAKKKNKNIWRNGSQPFLRSRTNEIDKLNAEIGEQKIVVFSVSLRVKRICQQQNTHEISNNSKKQRQNNKITLTLSLYGKPVTNFTCIIKL